MNNFVEGNGTELQNAQVVASILYDCRNHIENRISEREGEHWKNFVITQEIAIAIIAMHEQSVHDAEHYPYLTAIIQEFWIANPAEVWEQIPAARFDNSNDKESSVKIIDLARSIRARFNKIDYDSERVEFWAEEARAVIWENEFEDSFTVADLLILVGGKVGGSAGRMKVVMNELACVRGWICKALGIESRSHGFCDLPIDADVREILAKKAA